MSRPICSTTCIALVGLVATLAGCGNVIAGNGFYAFDSTATADAASDAAVADAAGADTTAADVAAADVPQGDVAQGDVAQADAEPADAQPADAAPIDAVAPDAAPDAQPDAAIDVPGSDTAPVLCKAKGDCAMGQTCDVPGCGVPGTCVPDPGGCPKNLDPVCGCDGVTYGNPCMLLVAGVGMASKGNCPVSGCTIGSSGDCPKGQFCAGPVGVCGGSGTCTTKPEMCPAVYSPVCGCDGNTYGNACEAGSAGVAVSASGECGKGKMCGGIAGFQCDFGQACDIQGCYPDAAGECITKPDFCPKLFAPVCGCDGQTYPNDCVRQQAGAAKDHDGECVNAGECYVGGDGASCGKGQFCKANDFSCGGFGVCVDIPMICMDLYSPVCGCNGQTYSNECYANGSGVNVMASGECPIEPPGMCGGFGGMPCGPDQMCDIQGCGFDMPGYCVPLPNNPCPKTTPDAQECGCDGNTYANACERQMGYVAFDYAGPCGAFIGCDTAAACPAGQGCLNGKCESCKPIPCAILCIEGYIPDPCTCQCYKP